MPHLSRPSHPVIEALESRIAPAAAFVLTADQVLLRFDTSSPSTILSAVVIDGLAAGETLAGIDFRPSDGKLYGFGEDRLYIIDPADGHAELAGPLTHFLGGTAANFGVDFNPVPDKLRVVSDLDTSYRLEPATGGIINQDTSLTSANPVTVSGVAYSNAYRGATQTTLYGIDVEGDQLVRIGGINGTPSPNGGVVTSVGPLGVSASGGTNFDIAGVGNAAFATIQGQGVTALFSIDLNSGEATIIGAVGDGSLRIVGLAVTGAERAIVTGADPGQLPLVTVVDPLSGGNLGSFFAYPASFAGGVRVATGDVNGDGVADIVTTPAKGKGIVRVFDGRDFSPIAGRSDEGVPAFGGRGGVASVAVGDFNGDGIADIAVSSDKGARIEIHDGIDGKITTHSYDLRGFGRGVFVAAGDVDGDGAADVIVGAGPGGGPHVKVFSGKTDDELLSNDPFPAKFRGGVSVGAGDVNGDGRADVIAGTATRDAAVVVIDGASGQLLSDFSAYDGFLGGVRVAAGDVNGDGLDDVITSAGPGGGPHVKVFDGQTGAVLDSFFVFDPSFRGGVSVAGGAMSFPKTDGLVEYRTPKTRGAVDFPAPRLVVPADLEIGIIR